jgi:hypothetical protein
LEPLGPLRIVNHQNHLMFSEQYSVRAMRSWSHSRVRTPRLWYCATNASFLSVRSPVQIMKLHICVFLTHPVY